MFEKILQLLSIHCRHKKTSQPFTATASSASAAEWETVGAGPSHYIVCLDCGKRIPYDWANMRRLG
ncbi:MAG: hypothetical protein LAO06_11340 [Acidobacteriia bacterium]|nr:hypothetical protein [Terriglobia bacterium]